MRTSTRVAPQCMWVMKAPRSSAASTADSLALRLSAISHACGSTPLAVRLTFVEGRRDLQLVERSLAFDRSDRRWCRGDAARLHGWLEIWRRVQTEKTP